MTRKYKSDGLRCPEMQSCTYLVVRTIWRASAQRQYVCWCLESVAARHCATSEVIAAFSEGEKGSRGDGGRTNASVNLLSG